MSFNTLGLSAPVMRAVHAAGYETPTEIQQRAIPPVLSGDDVIGRAKTGSGKTAAFTLPIIDRLDGGRRPARGIVRALVLTPTRELAQQVADSAKTYGRFTKLSSDAFYGGVSIEPQLKRMKKGVDILAATPGRLLDHLERGTVDLSQCEVLIVDEADRMFDMGFIKDVRRIIAKLPKNRQTLLFSATMSPEVRLLSSDIMRDPVFVEVGVENNPAESVQQRFYSVQKQEKLGLLFHLLKSREMNSVLVFSRTKHGANKIVRRLERGGIAAGVLHSNRTQSQRLSALAGFKEGRHRVLVATDIAARGIDVAGISHVVNYDTPAFAEDYVHRIGRTGRAEATGDAITFVAQDEKDYLRKIERFTGRRFTIERTPDGMPDARENQAAAPSHPRSDRNEGAGGNGQGRRRDNRQGKGRSNGKRQQAGRRRDESKQGKRNGQRRYEDGPQFSEDRRTSNRTQDDRRDTGRNEHSQREEWKGNKRGKNKQSRNSMKKRQGNGTGGGGSTGRGAGKSGRHRDPRFSY